MFLHECIRIWFHWVEVWGYWGVFILMAMESSIIPVPSEVVLPPAAFWAAQGRLDLAWVIFAGTAGSYVGSILSYGASRWMGSPLIHKYGRYVLLPPDKVELAQKWVQEFGVSGIFLARLLPVIRHLISIPAGIFKMPLLPFSLSTLFGAGLWCAILSWFGQKVIGSHPELLQSPEAMITALKDQLHGWVAGIVVLSVLYVGVLVMKYRFSQSNKHAAKA